MKSTLLLTTLLLGSVMTTTLPALAGDTNVTDAIELVRSTYQMDRQTFVAKKLELTATEAEKFKPLYESYRTEIDKIGDELVKLVLEYADVYPDVPEASAAKLLKKYLALEDKLTDAREKYFKRAGKILPATKAMRWLQIENRVDLALRLQLAGRIPIFGEEKNAR